MSSPKEEFSKYERARIIGARALQISMDAPLLIKISEEGLERINYDPLKIAEKELDGEVLPISVKRPLPLIVGSDIKGVKIEQSNLSDEEKIKVEQEEEREIAKGGEMMELTNTEEDEEDTSSFDKGEEDSESD